MNNILTTSEPNFSRHLLSFSERFVNHYERTDREFVALAQSLRRLYEIAQSLATLVSDRLSAVRQALDESRIAGPDGVVAAALEDLRDGLAEAAVELKELASVGSNLRQLQSTVGGIERVGQSIRASAFSFAIESARTDQCQHAFGSFTRDLRGLSDRVTRIAEAIESDLHKTRAAQQQEWLALSASHKQFSRLAEDLEITAIATANQTQKVLDCVLQGLQHAQEGMRQVTHHAGEVVFYLQFGDIIRQKTEHIAEALREAAGTLAFSDSGQEFRARASAADRILTIQIRQLEFILAEIESAQRQLSDSFHSLAEETDRIRETLCQWQTRPRGEEPDPIGALKAELLQMQTMHRQGHELRIAARRSTQNAVEASHPLAQHIGAVKSVNSDIHLQALNAIVKTATLGDQGATLSVLSMHVDSLYSESTEIVNSFVAVLELLLRQFQLNPASPNRDAEAQPENDLAAGMEKIQWAFDHCRSTFSEANELVEQQAKALEANHALLSFLAEQGPAIQNQIDELTSFRQVLAPWVESPKGVVPGVESLNHRYTMQSERDVHERATPLARADVDGNLELSPPPNSQCCGTTRFEPKSHPGRQASLDFCVPDSPTAGLGDNVELF